MSGPATAILRSLAFGDPEAGAWGAAWSPGGGSEVAISLGDGSGSTSRRVTIAGSGESEQWRLAGEGVDLTVSSARAAAPARGAGGGAGGFEQLCRVTGRLEVNGAKRAVDCPGRRALRTGVDLDRLGSVRDVSAWFGRDEGLALVSLRPRGAAGHERDALTAALFDALGAAIVTEPRLSTTYAAGGLPERASLELWLGDEQSEQQPHRAAGEAIGTALESRQDGFDLRTVPFRWRSCGREGAGAYLLARRR